MEELKMTLEEAIEILKEELDYYVENEEQDEDLPRAIKVVVGRYYHNLKRRSGRANKNGQD
jgi:hypothetical protein